jgi:hypothetical protein
LHASSEGEDEFNNRKCRVGIEPHELRKRMSGGGGGYGNPLDRDR